MDIQHNPHSVGGIATLDFLILREWAYTGITFLTIAAV